MLEIKDFSLLSKHHLEKTKIVLKKKKEFMLLALDFLKNN
jgi:hypothetical protein